MRKSQTGTGLATLVDSIVNWYWPCHSGGLNSEFGRETVNGDCDDLVFLTHGLEKLLMLTLISQSWPEVLLALS